MTSERDCGPEGQISEPQGKPISEAWNLNVSPTVASRQGRNTLVFSQPVAAIPQGDGSEIRIACIERDSTTAVDLRLWRFNGSNWEPKSGVRIPLKDIEGVCKSLMAGKSVGWDRIRGLKKAKEVG